MAVKKIASSFFNQGINTIQSALKSEKKGLRILLFHHVFKNREEISKNLVHPQESFTIENYYSLIIAFRKKGYKFISGSDLHSSLEPNDKYIMLTFDDGYANNARLIPLLEALEVPVTWFLSTNNIAKNRPYWWDIAWRGTVNSNKKNFSNLNERYISMNHEELVHSIKYRFGEDSFDRMPDLARPLTVKELKKYSRSKYVTIGSHTADHFNLASLGTEEIYSQLLDSKNQIESWLGQSPSIISYPYGRWNKEVEKVAEKLDYKVGITTTPKITQIPLNFDKCNYLQLGRQQLSGGKSLSSHFNSLRSDYNFNTLYHKVKDRIKIHER